ncbi:unnamed protein product, partial [Laminaria digitata]
MLLYMSTSQAMALYEACGRALKIYADQHAGSRRRVDPTSEEDSYDDVLCVLELLGHLVTKDIVDESDESDANAGEKVTAAVVVAVGLFVVVVVVVIVLV